MHYLPFRLRSIAIVRSGSYGPHCFDHEAATLAAVTSGARSYGGGAGDAGSERGRGEAHEVRVVMVKLKAVLAGEGAHGIDGNRSPEFLLSSGAHGRGRRRAPGM